MIIRVLRVFKLQSRLPHHSKMRESIILFLTLFYGWFLNSNSNLSYSTTNALTGWSRDWSIFMNIWKLILRVSTKCTSGKLDI